MTLGIMDTPGDGAARGTTADGMTLGTGILGTTGDGMEAGTAGGTRRGSAADGATATITTPMTSSARAAAGFTLRASAQPAPPEEAASDHPQGAPVSEAHQ